MGSANAKELGKRGQGIYVLVPVLSCLAGISVLLPILTSSAVLFSVYSFLRKCHPKPATWIKSVFLHDTVACPVLSVKILAVARWRKLQGSNKSTADNVLRMDDILQFGGLESVNPLLWEHWAWLCSFILLNYAEMHHFSMGPLQPQVLSPLSGMISSTQWWQMPTSSLLLVILTCLWASIRVTHKIKQLHQEVYVVLCCSLNN